MSFVVLVMWMTGYLGLPQRAVCLLVAFMRDCDGLSLQRSWDDQLISCDEDSVPLVYFLPQFLEWSLAGSGTLLGFPLLLQNS